MFKAQINLLRFKKKFKTSEILCVATFDIICIFSFHTKCIYIIPWISKFFCQKKKDKILSAKKNKKSLVQIIGLNVLKQKMLKYFTDIKNTIWVNARCNIFFYLLG
jgi:hypothetical protein